MLGLVVLTAASSAAVAIALEDELYTCRDAAGEVVLQNDPCERPKPAVAKPKPPAPAVKPAPKTAKPAKAVSASPPPAPPTARGGKLHKTASIIGTPIRPIINRSLFGSDPHWGSPERTLQTFIDAMRSGDRQLARSCLTSNALESLGPGIDSGPADAMRSTVDDYTGFVLEGEVGPFWSIRALRSQTRPKWIFFERFSDGTWKIAAI